MSWHLKLGDMATIINVDEIVYPRKQLQRYGGDAVRLDFVTNTHVFNIKQVSEPVSKIRSLNLIPYD
jgi:hypothetical protein